MLMNANERLATLQYQPNGFRVVMPGSHVRCAVTGDAILLEMLRYWCVERQEAYASCDAATRRLVGAA